MQQCANTGLVSYEAPVDINSTDVTTSLTRLEEITASVNLHKHIKMVSIILQANRDWSCLFSPGSGLECFEKRPISSITTHRFGYVGNDLDTTTAHIIIKYSSAASHENFPALEELRIQYSHCDRHPSFNDLNGFQKNYINAVFKDTPHPVDAMNVYGGRGYESQLELVEHLVLLLPITGHDEIGAEIKESLSKELSRNVASYILATVDKDPDHGTERGRVLSICRQLHALGNDEHVIAARQSIFKIYMGLVVAEVADMKMSSAERLNLPPIDLTITFRLDTKLELAIQGLVEEAPLLDKRSQMQYHTVFEKPEQHYRCQVGLQTDPSLIGVFSVEMEPASIVARKLRFATLRHNP